jgi:hypothetical protein
MGDAATRRVKLAWGGFPEFKGNDEFLDLGRSLINSERADFGIEASDDFCRLGVAPAEGRTRRSNRTLWESFTVVRSR